MRPHLLNNSHIVCITHFLKELQKPKKVNYKKSKQSTQQIRSLHWFPSEFMQLKKWIKHKQTRGERIVFWWPNTNTNIIRFEKIDRIPKLCYIFWKAGGSRISTMIIISSYHHINLTERTVVLWTPFLFWCLQQMTCNWADRETCSIERYLSNRCEKKTLPPQVLMLKNQISRPLKITFIMNDSLWAVLFSILY